MFRPFRMRTGVGLALLAAMAVLPMGCEDDDSFSDHVPPVGRGSLIVNNETGDDIEFYLNGVLVREVGDYSDHTVDLAPGVYRVVLSDEDGDRSWRDDVDVLLDRLVILHVSRDENDHNDYDVAIEIDD